uniref:Uncharacterized protein n=1 Tax=Ditylenchus dipsaci TaxID=166011 RepID=A0A915E115_9BILA
MDKDEWPKLGFKSNVEEEMSDNVQPSKQGDQSSKANVNVTDKAFAAVLTAPGRSLAPTGNLLSKVEVRARSCWSPFFY